MTETESTKRDEKELRIASAQYETVRGRLELELTGGAMEGTRLSFIARHFPGLEAAGDAQLGAFIVGDEGQSIRWPEANVGIGPVALVRWACGLHETTLSRHLSNIGRIRSDAKRADHP